MSSGFWEAFWMGLGCSADLYFRGRQHDYRHLGRVDTAWKSVGGYIYESIDTLSGKDNRDGDRQEK
jgi:hypothetical protein